MVDFLKEYDIDSEICDNVIKFFTEHPVKHAGLCGASEWKPMSKSSTDVSLEPEDMDHPLIAPYIDALWDNIDKYKEEFPECYKDLQQWYIQGINVQHYAPKQGYYKWHCERCGAFNSTRHLVFSTFLNTVTEGGHTEFLYQKRAVEPTIGKTIIWPADWTYTHKGRVSKTQDKYIITGWLNFIP